MPSATIVATEANGTAERTATLNMLDDLKATHLQRLRHNFLRFDVVPGELDWFDDYSAVINNARVAAKVARAAAVPAAS